MATNPEKVIDEELAGVESNKNGEVQDEVFGNVEEGGPNFRSVSWMGASVLMMKSEMGIGILSIPQAFGTLGLIPGIIVLLVISAITTWSSYVVGVFKLKHPQAYGFADTAEIIFGPIGREVASIAFCLLWIFVAASGLLGVSIGLNAVSSHGTCTATLVAVSAIMGFGVASVRTLSKMSWLAWAGMISIVAAGTYNEIPEDRSSTKKYRSLLSYRCRRCPRSTRRSTPGGTVRFHMGALRYPYIRRGHGSNCLDYLRVLRCACLLLCRLRDGGSERIPEISGALPWRCNKRLSHHRYRRLLLLRHLRRLTCIRICWRSHEESLLWSRHPRIDHV